MVTEWKKVMKAHDPACAEEFEPVFDSFAYTMAGFSSLTKIIRASRKEASASITPFHVVNKLQNVESKENHEHIERRKTQRMSDEDDEISDDDEEIQILNQNDEYLLPMEQYIVNAPWKNSFKTTWSGTFNLTEPYVIYIH